MRDFGTSGDLIADRRFKLALEALDQEDITAAIDLFTQTIELVPRWPVVWFHLGIAEFDRNDKTAARDAFRKALTLDLADHLGTRLYLALLGDGHLDKAMSPAYVAALFDDYAPRFESHLVRNLDYHGPEILREALRAGAARSGKPFRFRNMIDLGCGTGLMAAALEKQALRKVGVDLSTKMLARARKAAMYQRLVNADMTVFLDSEPPASADLVVAADSLIYLGSLERVFAGVAQVLVRNGLFAFTVQSSVKEGYHLGPDLRFAHHPTYLRDLLLQAGLRIQTIEPLAVRKNLGEPVPGLVVVAERGA